MSAELGVDEGLRLNRENSELHGILGVGLVPTRITQPHTLVPTVLVVREEGVLDYESFVNN